MAVSKVQQRILVEFRRRLALVRHACERVPGLISGRGWQKFWGAAQGMPPEDLPGFVALHRARLDASRYMLAYDGDALADLPAPLNTTKGFAAMGAFLGMASWDMWQSGHATAKAWLERAGDDADPTMRVHMQCTLDRTNAYFAEPFIMDSIADLYAHVDRVGSFDASLAAYRTLAATRAGDPAYAFVLQHPDFLWIEPTGAAAELARHYAPRTYGKWICALNDLRGAVTLTQQLLPAFRDGHMSCAKFCVTTTYLGGLYYLAYSPYDATVRRDLLGEATGQDPFFVYDADCHEAGALKACLTSFTGRLRLSDFEQLDHKRRRYIALMRDPHFGEAHGISDVQRKILLAALQMNPESARHDRFNFIAMTYFDGWYEQLPVYLPKFFDIAVAARVRRFMTTQRARTRI